MNTLFNQANVRCHWCDEPLTIHTANPHLLHGFHDTDNGRYVCRKRTCIVRHYVDKRHTDGSTTYSEVPIPVNAGS